MNSISIRRHVVAAAACALALGAVPMPAAAQSDAQIRQKIIKASIANYLGNCPCPYNTKSNGHRCGGNSAYSRAGGEAPKCYPADVTKAEVNAWRGR
ncbi:MAG TPA: hypothetical protein VNT25_05590 [Allosphingosinicella sp.]|nr:hypothetical protein [Allosphingosinicella sp.]